MRDSCLLEIEFKVDPQRFTEFNVHLAMLRESSVQNTRREAIFEDKTDATSFLWMSEWASRGLLTDFVGRECVQAGLNRIAACALLVECRIVKLDHAAASFKRSKRGIRQLVGQEFDLPGFSVAGGDTPRGTVPDRP